MKKYLWLITLGASAFLSVLTLLLMLAPGISTTLLGTNSSVSVYKLMSYDGGVGVVFSLIFTIIELLAAIGLCAIAYLKIQFKFDWLIAFCAAFIAVLGCIFFFLTKVFVGYGESSVVGLGAGAILCAIFSLLNACALAFYGLQLKKQ